MATIKKSSKGYLEGQFLIATPTLQESCFSKTVVYLCSHDATGAMGLIINQTLDIPDAEKVLKQFRIPTQKRKKMAVHFGGPVDMVRGFVLHSTDYQSEDTFAMNEDIALTSSIDILRDIVEGTGPKKHLLALGYSGWTANQLEREIEANSWLSVPASTEIIFDSKNEVKWQKAAKSVGVDLLKFSDQAGHA
ncbi:MAG: YqgE/AlgH family protein [Proteobacteria bacterium]|nr:YqgE/AlgH family protein [Pseudomonadota bacterium]